MAFRKPFRAAPVRPASHIKRQRRKRELKSIALLLGGAATVGLVVGTASMGALPGWRTIEVAMKPLAVAMGLMRARAPQPGDVWQGCNEARTAGTAPIYAGEPGYSEDMDGDGDGIACEPYRGA